MENNPFSNLKKNQIENSGNLEIENLRKELLNFLNDNRIYFNKVESREHQINSAVSLGGLKKMKFQFEQYLSAVDKEKCEKMEEFRQRMFQLIAENNLIVDKDFLKQIATQNRMAELKHLMFKLKEKHKLSFQDLENTTNSVKPILGGLYGQGKSRKH